MSQSLSQLWVHIIFSTRNREPFLKSPRTQKRMHEYIKEICHKNDCNTVIVGGTEDHIHLLTNLSKNLTLSHLVEIIKKSTSKWAKTLKEDNISLDSFYWQSGYGAFSVSQSNVNAVAIYIKNQNIHHKKQNFQSELIQFFRRHGIPYNEKYLWD